MGPGLPSVEIIALDTGKRLTIALIPLTCSLIRGFVYGMLAFTLIRLNGNTKEIPLSLILIDLFSIFIPGI